MNRVLQWLSTTFALTAAFMLIAEADEMPTISIKEAYSAAAKNQLLLIDVRTRHEWKQTGIPDTAIPISIHDGSFMRKLNKLAGSKTRPIALICSVAGRSRDVQRKLISAGYTSVFNVREGVMGNEHGFGWNDEDLPMVPYTEPIAQENTIDR